MNLSAKIFIFFAALFTSNSTYTALQQLKEEPRYTFVPRALLIFLDDSETWVSQGPMSTQFIAALQQKAGPILVSASIAMKLFGAKEAFASLKVGEYTKSAYASKFAAAKKAIAFEPNQWTIKKVNNSLYLFLPHKYLEQLNIKSESVTPFTPEAISQAELDLGLKVNHMPSISVDDIISQEALPEYKTADYFLKAIVNSESGDSDIFCTRSNYRDARSALPLWSFYITGHGLPGKKIVYISLNDFQKLLSFLEQRINTKALVYISCFSGGLNAKIIYKATATAVQTTYPFVIIAAGLTDVQVLFPPTMSGAFETRGYNFPEFIRLMTNTEVPNYRDVIHSLLEKHSILVHSAFQIKLPGVPWFSVEAKTNPVVSIGSILAKTRKSDSPLDITKFFKTDPVGILLYAENIPFDLIINTKKASQFIFSMIPGTAYHRIAGISHNKTLIELLHLFYPVYTESVKKHFYIKTIRGINEQGEQEIGYDAVIAVNDPSGFFEAWYKDKDNVLQKSATGEGIHPAIDEPRYEALLLKIKQPPSQDN